MKSPLRIPTKFELHGQTINVLYDNALIAKTDSRGEAHARNNIIYLQPNNDGCPQPQTSVEQAFCHELTHFILQHMESDKNNDEIFVNLFGNLLHQALVTAEYEKIK